MIGWRQQCNGRKERILTFIHTEARINAMDGEKDSVTQHQGQRGEGPCYCQRIQAVGALV